MLTPESRTSNKLPAPKSIPKAVNKLDNSSLSKDAPNTDNNSDIETSKRFAKYSFSLSGASLTPASSNALSYFSVTELK